MERAPMHVVLVTLSLAACERLGMKPVDAAQVVGVVLFATAVVVMVWLGCFATVDGRHLSSVKVARRRREVRRG